MDNLENNIKDLIGKLSIEKADVLDTFLQCMAVTPAALAEADLVVRPDQRVQIFCRTARRGVIVDGDADTDENGHQGQRQQRCDALYNVGAQGASLALPERFDQAAEDLAETPHDERQADSNAGQRACGDHQS